MYRQTPRSSGRHGLYLGRGHLPELGADLMADKDCGWAWGICPREPRELEAGSWVAGLPGLLADVVYGQFFLKFNSSHLHEKK